MTDAGARHFLFDCRGFLAGHRRGGYVATMGVGGPVALLFIAVVSAVRGVVLLEARLRSGSALGNLVRGAVVGVSL